MGLRSDGHRYVREWIKSGRRNTRHFWDFSPHFLAILSAPELGPLLELCPCLCRGWKKNFQGEKTYKFIEIREAASAPGLLSNDQRELTPLCGHICFYSPGREERSYHVLDDLLIGWERGVL